jgi:hypothetical protein
MTRNSNPIDVSGNEGTFAAPNLIEVLSNAS